MHDHLASRLAAFGTIILAILFGYLLGRITTHKLSIPLVPTTLVKDTRPLVPTVHLFGIQNGKLIGQTRGDVRFIIGKKSIIPSPDGSLHTDAGPLLVNEIEIIVPIGSAFVASKRGKKYYPVSSSKGALIVPGNRVYFTSREEAENAGFVP